MTGYFFSLLVGSFVLRLTFLVLIHLLVNRRVNSQRFSLLIVFPIPFSWSVLADLWRRQTAFSSRKVVGKGCQNEYVYVWESNPSIEGLGISCVSKRSYVKMDSDFEWMHVIYLPLFDSRWMISTNNPCQVALLGYMYGYLYTVVKLDILPETSDDGKLFVLKVLGDGYFGPYSISFIFWWEGLHRKKDESRTTVVITQVESNLQTNRMRMLVCHATMVDRLVGKISRKERRGWDIMREREEDLHLSILCPCPSCKEKKRVGVSSSHSLTRFVPHTRTNIHTHQRT